MSDGEFTVLVREAQAQGQDELRATLRNKFRGVRHVAIRNLDGRANGNPHDLWIESVSGLTTIGRAYLGSTQRKQNLEGWPQRIASLRGTTRPLSCE